MNGVDPYLDRLERERIAEEEVEKERQRLDKLPKQWVMGVDGYEFKHVRETPKRELPHMEMPKFKERSKTWFIDGMKMPQGVKQDIPLEMMYTKEELETGIRKDERKTKLSLDDFSDHVKRSYF